MSLLPAEFDSWPLDQKNEFIKNLKYNWKFWARPNQIMPNLDDPWTVWMIMAGRGFGKTRTGAESIKQLMLENPGCRIGIIGMTAGAVRDVCFEGESGILAVLPPELWDRKNGGKYNRSLGQLTLSNGSMAFSFSGADPEKLRGFQSNYLWMDELALDVNTPIATPKGWTLMGDLVAGDELFNEQGEVIVVTQAHPVQSLNEFIVTFDDGSKISACGDHQWVTVQSRQRRAGNTDWSGGSVVSTSEIMGSLEYNGQFNHQVPLNGPLRGSDEELSLDPYTLGLWLGDGVRTHAQILIASTEIDILDHIPYTHRKTSAELGAGVALYQFDGLAAPLAALFGPVISRVKSVPPQYLRASVESRLELLRGLMDSDGWVTSARGRVGFATTSPRIAEGFLELVSSLGIKTTYRLETNMVYKNSRGEYISCKDKHSFSLSPTVQVFKCFRKSSRFNGVEMKNIRRRNRSIVSVTKSGRVIPMRCISVSGASQMFLAGTRMVPTHNCAFQYSQETWDMAIMGLRLGQHPRVIITTTPKPSPLIVELVHRGQSEPENLIITTGSTFDNKANLPKSTLEELRKRYEGTTMGRQELYAELILDDPGALWNRALIEELRISVHDFDITKMQKIVVAIDPSMSSVTERDSETGIVIAGLGVNGHCYIIEDCSALRPSPDTWSRLAIAKYHEYAANRIVAEVNQGYDLVTNLLNTHDDTVPVKKVYATRGGKFLRAEPIAALYEQKRVHHVGLHAKLEDQMTQWIPGKASPDRLDAMVWAVTDLMLGGGVAEFFTPSSLPNLPSILGTGRRGLGH